MKILLLVRGVEEKTRLKMINKMKGLQTVDKVHVWNSDSGFAPLVSEYILVDHKNKTITFKLQDGNINAVGENGCTVDTLIKVSAILN